MTDDTEAGTGSMTSGSQITSLVRLPEIEEVIDVRRRQVDTGGFRIEKKVEVHEETVDEVLRDRRVEVERRPIGRTISGEELPGVRYEGDTMIVPVIEEVLVVEKRLVLVEEVRITRVEGTHRKPQQVSVRKERIVVEPLATAVAKVESD